MIYSDFHRLTKEECAIDHAWEAQAQPRSQDRWYSTGNLLPPASNLSKPPTSQLRTHIDVERNTAQLARKLWECNKSTGCATWNMFRNTLVNIFLGIICSAKALLLARHVV